MRTTVVNVRSRCHEVSELCISDCRMHTNYRRGALVFEYARLRRYINGLNKNIENNNRVGGQN